MRGSEALTEPRGLRCVLWRSERDSLASSPHGRWSRPALLPSGHRSGGGGHLGKGLAVSHL